MATASRGMSEACEGTTFGHRGLGTGSGVGQGWRSEAALGVVRFARSHGACRLFLSGGRVVGRQVQVVVYVRERGRRPEALTVVRPFAALGPRLYVV